MTTELSDAEVDKVLERFDATDPKLQRRIIAELVQRAALADDHIPVPPFDDEVRWIMGRPNFVTGPFAHLLRAMGHTIPTKCEEEQAYTIHWWLTMYAKHGSDWRRIVDEECEPIRQKLRDQRAAKEAAAASPPRE